MGSFSDPSCFALDSKNDATHLGRSGFSGVVQANAQFTEQLELSPKAWGCGSFGQLSASTGSFSQQLKQAGYYLSCNWRASGQQLVQ